MKITKDIGNEINITKKIIRDNERKLLEIREKIMINIEYEKAGDYAPYDYKELHAEAEALRTQKEDAPAKLSDEAALFMSTIFPVLNKNGMLIKAGARINWNGTLKRATVDLWDLEENNPDNAPALWEDVAYSGDVRVIPEVITVTSAFSKGELGKWNGVIYESLIDANVWTPAQYPAGWQVKE